MKHLQPIWLGQGGPECLLRLVCALRFLPLFVASLLGAALLVSCSKHDAASAPGAGLRNLPVPVTITNAASRDIPMQILGIGNVHPFSTVAVKSQIKGQLMRVGFKQGDEVHANDLIFLIDPRPYETALVQARANLDRDQALLVKAQADYRRAFGLLTNNIVSESDFEQNRATVDSLKATLASDAAAITNAALQLEYCHLRSPITGRVGTLLVNEGNLVKDTDTTLAVVNQIKPIYVDFGVPEQFLGDIRARLKSERLKVTAFLSGTTRASAEGELVVVNNEVDTTTGRILLRAEFANLEEVLWPGQFVNVALTLTIAKQAVVVPTATLQLSQQGSFVCLVKPDETVEFRPVEPGQVYEQFTVIKQGLQAGERVVTSGQIRLIPGSKVKLLGAETSPAHRASTNASPRSAP